MNIRLRLTDAIDLALKAINGSHPEGAIWSSTDRVQSLLRDFQALPCLACLNASTQRLDHQCLDGKASRNINIGEFTMRELEKIADKVSKYN